MILVEQPIFSALAPKEDDTRLALGSLNRRLSIPWNDFSDNAKNGTASGGVVNLSGGGASLDGTDDKIDYGDLGNITEVALWVNPGSTSEQIVLVDTGKTITAVSGTITYTGLTATATYVNGVASTTLAAGVWQHVVCQFAVTDANNFELGYDGTGYGDIDVRDLRAYTSSRAAAEVAVDFARAVPDSTLRLAVDGSGRDRSRYATTVTPSGGIVLGSRMTLDGTNDKLDAGDIGNIVEISAWVKPSSTTQELFLVDTGKDIMVNSGTVTYTGLTATATYVNGVAGTTLAAGVWQHLVCQFAVTDANNMELGNDGSNYGAFDCDMWCARTTARSVAAVLLEYQRTRGEH